MIYMFEAYLPAYKIKLSIQQISIEFAEHKVLST